MKVINLKGLRNSRDIGGYINKDGKKIVGEKFIRSCELSKTNKKTRKVLLNDHNIKTIIDFRTDVELRKKPIPKMKDVSIIHLPVLEDENLGIPRNFKQFKNMWKLVLTDNVPPETFMINMYLNMAFSDYSAKKYQEFFKIILDNPDGAILYNCTEGKDRTGLATMFLMLTLNFDKETIINDYMVSKSFCDIKKNVYYKRCKRFFIGKRITNFLTGIMSTKEMFINAVFDKIERDYKTIENFLYQRLNLKLNDILKLQNLFLV